MATVLFVAAHPDDETLAMGVPIAEHVAAGVHDVHVLTLNRSTGSVVRDYLNGTTASSWWGTHILHVPADEGYAVLDEPAFGDARIGERDRAVDCLRSGLGPVTLHDAGLTGGFSAAAAQAAILAVADAIAPAGVVWLKGHTYLVAAAPHAVDDHPEHLAAGQAIVALKAADPVRFANTRHYVMPNKWTDSAVMAFIQAQCGVGWPKWDYPSDAAIGERVVNAARAYGAWAPPASYAIGWHSVYGSMFAPLLAGPKGLFHP